MVMEYKKKTFQIFFAMDLQQNKMDMVFVYICYVINKFFAFRYYSKVSKRKLHNSIRIKSFTVCINLV